ncbi:MAG: 50S ribosomal protein L17 [Verrucomicrobiia bacterium]
MRHRAKTVKLGRTSQHRDAMLANLVVSLIQHKRIQTTVAKAKAAKPLAEKMVTLGKKGDLAARRLAAARLGNPAAVQKLFKNVAPLFKERQGGYTRIIKIGNRTSDAAPMALLEWTEVEQVVVATSEPAKTGKKSVKSEEKKD